MGFDCARRTHVGLRRKLNEDALATLTDRGLWVVADGMGGHEAGEVASASVVEALSSLAPESDLDGLTREAVSALQEVNGALIAMAQGGPAPRTIGSTVVGLAIGQRQYRCFWAGDSRAYRMRGGVIEQLTRDHSLVQDLVDAGMVPAEDAEKHPNANVITRAVGAAPELKVDVVGGMAESGDLFLLASDGLTRLVSQVELLSTLYSKPIEEAADFLVETVLARGAPDNVTLVIVRVV